MGEGTMLIPKLSAKHSISVPMMEMEDEPSTVSSVLMELSSNSSTLYVTGGSMLTALLLNSFTLLMMKLLLRELPTHLKVPVVMTIKEELVEGEVVQVDLKEQPHLLEDLIQRLVEDLEMMALELMPATEPQDLVDFKDPLSVDIPGEMLGILTQSLAILGMKIARDMNMISKS